MTSVERKRVAVLISGRGSNMEALIRAAIDPSYPCKIVGVLTDRADAAGLKIAARNSIRHWSFPLAEHASRLDQEAAMTQCLKTIDADLICLAGYMRILSAGFVEQWRGRILNIHPSLLPAFKGIDTHARALAAGVRIHGCTVHFVTADMDEGPVIAQAALSVRHDEDADSLSGRVLDLEHRIYPGALAMVATGKVRMSGARSIFGTSGSFPDGELFSPQFG